jgi:hypothetical protein
MHPTPQGERQRAHPQPDPLSDDVIDRWTRETRAACGLPPTIEDPAALARLVTLALDPDEGSGG